METLEQANPTFTPDNPTDTSPQTEAQKEAVRLLESYHANVNDENPIWFKHKTDKTRRGAACRYKLVNLFPCENAASNGEVPVQVPKYVVVCVDPLDFNPQKPQKHITQGHMDCAKFVAAYEKAADPPPSVDELLKKRK